MKKKLRSINTLAQQLNGIQWQGQVERIPQSVPAQEVDPSFDRGTKCNSGKGSAHVE